MAPAAIAARQRQRLAEMVSFACGAPPYDREQPDRVESLEQLPVPDRKMLMDRFDDWVTDRAMTLDAAQAFVDDPDRIGERVLERLMVMMTSGTIGRPRRAVTHDADQRSRQSRAADLALRSRP